MLYNFVLLLITTTSLSLSPAPCGSVEYYVTPILPPSTVCPLPCYTLDHYALNSLLLCNKENVSLLFLEGLHTLNETLIISGTRKLHMTQVDNTSDVVLHCEKDITFKHVTHLKIEKLTIYGNVNDVSNCEHPLSTQITNEVQTALLQHLIIKRVKLVIAVNCNITLYKVNMIESRIVSDSACKDVKLIIIGCTLYRQRARSLYFVQANIEFDIGPAANILVEMTDTVFDGELLLLGKQENNNITLFIHRSEIRNVSDIQVRLGFEARKNTIRIQITDCTFHDIKMSALTFKVKTNFAIEDDQEERPVEKGTVNQMNISIENCTFVKNRKALVIEVESYINLKLGVMVSDSNFNGNDEAINFRKFSIPKLASQGSCTIRSHLFMSLNNVKIENSSEVIHLFDVGMLFLKDCTIINNQGSAIESLYSGVTLDGHILFSNNTSIKGGALLLYESHLHLSALSNISFVNNRAHEVGGAIYVKLRPAHYSIFYNTPTCFYELLEGSNLSLNFKGNLALGGGDDIYGGSLQTWCSNTPGTIDKMFHFQNKTISSVASDPTRLCLCDDHGRPQCSNFEFIYRELQPHYPGEVFTVPAIVVGYDFGTVPGIVFSELLGSDGNSSIGHNQGVQEIEALRECTLLNFSIETPQTGIEYRIQFNASQNTITDKIQLLEAIKLFVEYERLSAELLNQAVLISVLLEDCPTGFMLTSTPPYICTCHSTLVDNGIKVCIITNHTGWVYRSGTVWVSDSFTGNETNSFVVHQYCPYDYCKPENISVDLRFPETQCSFNHSGVLCGGCYGKFSLALGTSRCLLCDNRLMSLLIFFIFTGFALVFFIKVLDLTVAKGTINGLIFYANIVWANKSILFPVTETLHPLEQILHTFIAWLNLDLGIETCFMESLDAYWKTWLQFVFPLYVWTITGVVIIASHYSTRASKIFGNNSVPVLATLILLSYTKLLRTIITSLGFSLLEYPEGTRAVWSFDGNVSYFGAAHTILFLVALAALLLLWLPYTTVLLTLQLLRRKSYLKPLRWINRWKPFFDAYFGQLKPKHYYWIGLLLLVRVILLVLFASTSAVVPKLNILAMVISGNLLLVKQIYTGSMYKSLHLSILENSFIVNLTILGVGKLYMLPNDPGHKPVIYTSIGVVFIVFLAIVIYHTWERLKSTYLTYKRRHRVGENTTTDGQLRVVAAVPHNHMHYREPLLDSSVQD